jgi:excisionase family DNA binding protein
MSTTIVPAGWLTSKAVAEMLAVSVRTVWRLVRDGKLPQPLRVNRKLVRFSAAGVAEALDAMLCASATGAPAGDLPADLVTLEEAELLADCSRSTLWLRLREGALHSWRGPDGLRRVSRAELLALAAPAEATAC